MPTAKETADPSKQVISTRNKGRDRVAPLPKKFAICTTFSATSDTMIFKVVAFEAESRQTSTWYHQYLAKPAKPRRRAPCVNSRTPKKS